MAANYDNGNWDYADHSTAAARKFLAMPKAGQLRLLEDMYPAGQSCRKFNINLQALGEGEYEIAGYADRGDHWSVRLTARGARNSIEENPAYVAMPEEFIKERARAAALGRLLKNK